MGVDVGGKVARMMLSWQWPLAALIAVIMAVLLIVAIVLVSERLHRRDAGYRAFSLDDDLNTERAADLYRQWRMLSRVAAALMALALVLAIALIARPSDVDAGSERTSDRDIVLCLDVSGSALPYDRQVIETYRDLVANFEGERIGLSIFNSTSRTVFPLTDDYELVATQLDEAEQLLRGVESQDDIDAMSDEDYQRVSDWLDGTQNRTNATSLIGDGLVSCAAMLPGFAYGSAHQVDGERQRAASIVLATDNVVSGDPTYSLEEALDLISSVGIDVDGLYSGPRESESDTEATQMQSLIESNDGVFLTQSHGGSIDELVHRIERRRTNESEERSRAALVDAPGWWTMGLSFAVAAWLIVSWRLRR